jgi:hypothetical protein
LDDTQAAKQRSILTLTGTNEAIRALKFGKALGKESEAVYFRKGIDKAKPHFASTCGMAGKMQTFFAGASHPNFCSQRDFKLASCRTLPVVGT